MIQLTSEKLQGGSLTRIQGALDGSTYQQFSEQVKQQVDAEGRAILDFKDVESVNSEGLRALLALNHWIKARNGALIIVGLSGQAQEAFKSSGCDRLLKSYPDAATAMHAEGMSAAAPGLGYQAAIPQNPPPIADAPTIPAQPQRTIPQSTVPGRAETEWVKRPAQAPTSTPLGAGKTPPAKGSFPLLLVLGTLLAVIAIAGLIILFLLPDEENKEEPVTINSPQISTRASYDLQVGTEAEVTIHTQYTERLSLDGSLPEGLRLNHGDSEGEWQIDGTPSEAGSFQVTLVATGSESDESISESIRLVIAEPVSIVTDEPQPPVIQTDSLPDAIVGETYEATIEATNATSITASGLPSGLAFEAANRTLSGTLAGPGDFQLTFTATGEGGSVTKSLSLTSTEAQTGPQEFQEGDELTALKADLVDRVDLAPQDPTIKAQIIRRIPAIKQATKVWTVPFTVGGTEMGNAERELLRLAMNDPIVKSIKDTKGAIFFALGYADPTGSREANFALSRERAQSVAKFLKDSFDIDQPMAVPMGPTDLLDPRREYNRAVEVWAIVP